MFLFKGVIGVVIKYVLRVSLFVVIIIYFFPDMPSIVLGAIGEGLGTLAKEFTSHFIGDLKEEIVNELKGMIKIG